MANEPPFAEYPRPSGPSFGYNGRGPGVYFDAIGESWNIVRQDLGTWMVTSLVFFILSMVVLAPVLAIYIPASMAMQTNPSAGSVLLFILSYLLLVAVSSISQQFFLTGMIAMAVRKLRGEPIEFAMLFAPLKNVGPLLGSSALYGVIVFAAVLACGLPALYFGPILLLMPTVAYFRNVGAKASLSTTYETCKPHWGGLLGLSIVMYLIITLSVYVCCVPVLITIPMFAVVMGIHYRAFFESQLTTVGEMPPTTI